MDSLSATWTQMPAKWQQPLIEGVLTLAEASEMWDLLLQSPDEWIAVPPHLQPAVDRLLFWQMQIDPTRH